MTELTKPVRACRLTLSLDADTRKEMALALCDFAHRIEAGELTVGVGASPSAGSVYEFLEDRSITHTSYHAALRTYLTEKKSAGAPI